MSKKDYYLSAYKDKSASPLRKTLKATKYTNIDNGLTNFITYCYQSGLMVSDKLLKENALEIAKVANIVDFKASNGYLEKYKQRNKIMFTTIHGEESSVDVNVVERWLGNQLKDHIHLLIQLIFITAMNWAFSGECNLNQLM